jgi:calcyclin binding protein
VAPVNISMSSAILEDIRALLPQAQRSNSRAVLERELRRQLGLASTAASHSPPPPLKKESVEPVGPTFTALSKYAWDQSKKFVKIYVTLPGIEQLPDKNIALEVKSSSFNFEVRGLPAPYANMRLAVPVLHSAVDASQCSYVRKADSMILIKLRKVDEASADWGSLDDSATQKARKKENDLEENKGKSTQGACLPQSTRPATRLLSLAPREPASHTPITRVLSITARVHAQSCSARCMPRPTRKAKHRLRRRGRQVGQNVKKGVHDRQGDGYTYIYGLCFHTLSQRLTQRGALPTEPQRPFSRIASVLPFSLFFFVREQFVLRRVRPCGASAVASISSWVTHGVTLSSILAQW